MAYVDNASKTITIKVVYYGPGLSGKTTCLHYIYAKTAPDMKGKMISLATETERTLYFDFLPITLGEMRGVKVAVRLYSIPGQVFYEANRRLILRGVDGVVFVVDSQAERMEANIESFENLTSNLELNGRLPSETPLVFQYNKIDLPNALPFETLQEHFNPTGALAFRTCAISGHGVFDGLKSITTLVLRKIHGEAAPDDRELAATPFGGLAPGKIASSLAEKLLAKERKPSWDPFFRMKVDFPRTFPLGVSGCSVAIPPRELPGSLIVDQLAGRADASTPLTVVLCPSPSQKQETRKAGADKNQMLVALDPWELRKITDSESSKEEFARAVAAQVTPAQVSPYSAANGVDNDAVFFGRVSLLERILTRGRANYLLVGGRRLGKTALLQALHRRRQPPKPRDDQQDDQPHDQECVFVSLAGDDLASRLGGELGLSPECTFDEVERHLRAGPYRLLLIDEVDLFIDGEETREFSTLRRMRALSSSGCCNFVIAGHWTLFRNATLDYQSPLLNFGEVLRIGSLEQDACFDFARKPMEILGVKYGGANDGEDTIVRLATASGGRANVISRICCELLDTIGDRREISREALEAVMASARVRSELEGWKHLSGRSGRDTAFARANRLDRMVVYATIGEGGFDKRELLRRLRALDAEPTAEALDESLVRLELDYVIKRMEDNSFIYAVPLLREHILADGPEDLLDRELRLAPA